jgi:DNA-binding transcriptional ArsR family regulator
MPGRALVSKQMAELFGVLAHPYRIRIIEELRNGEVDVNGLTSALGATHSRVSQQLAVLRAHRLVVERRDGRHVFYHLSHPHIAEWVLSGADFLRADITAAEELRTALQQVHEVWGSDGGSAAQ